MTTSSIEIQTKTLIDDLKATCASYGLGNDGNEYKIITQIFLYKFLNDKFGYEVKNVEQTNYRTRLKSSEKWEDALKDFTDEEYKDLLSFLPADSPKLRREHFISNMWNQQTKGDFSTLFDATMVDIANYNAAIFSMKTESETKLTLFENITIHIPDSGKRDDFARALIAKLVNFNFEKVFSQKYDFFSTIFEYLIKDYNKDGGGKYAEYFTPHSVASIMAQLLVKEGEDISDVSCYDPSAGSGTLLMAIAHAIGEERCTIFSQDISQKSSKMLRLNLILNNLVHSIPNIIQGDTLVSPYHKTLEGRLQKFDYIVSNPPFKLDFSDTQPKLIDQKSRFFAGVPAIAKAKKESMGIYLCFLQHIINSLSAKGKAAVVVPSGFVTAGNGIEKKIREHLVNEKMIRGVVSMPSNIFATTGTNVSVLFLDKQNADGKVVLIDASKLGATVKEDGTQRTKLSSDDIDQIVNTFHNRLSVEDFAVAVSYNEIKEKNYSFSAGQYMDVKIEYTDITPREFVLKMNGFRANLKSLFTESQGLEMEIQNQLEGLEYE
ncbi:MAG: type I restriction-modification system subunit M [Prolixibacteraceae bacterium]|nr:type I restriction-modification system subunit M [Prolixibacteraceae bacterium]